MRDRAGSHSRGVARRVVGSVGARRHGARRVRPDHLGLRIIGRERRDAGSFVTATSAAPSREPIECAPRAALASVDGNPADDDRL
jgi:hypothetical protein